MSFLDTKSLFQTCVLSKAWRYRWTRIESLNLQMRSNRLVKFKEFVLGHVLPNHRSDHLKRLSFLLRYVTSPWLMTQVSIHAKARGLEELETNLVSFIPMFSQCNTLRILKLNNCCPTVPDLSTFTSLKILELNHMKLDTCSFFSGCPNLETLKIDDCQVVSLTIEAPNLVKLVISNFKSVESPAEIAICAPRLQSFEMKEVHPLLELSLEDCPSLKKVDIQVTPPTLDMQLFFLLLIEMVSNLFHVNSSRMVINFTNVSCHQHFHFHFLIL